MKLRRHVDRKKVGVKLETTEVEWREGERGGGFIYPAWRSLAATPARWFCASLKVSYLSSHPKRHLSPR